MNENKKQEKDLRTEQEKLAHKRYNNKNLVLSQIEINKAKQKEDKWRNLQDEKKMIKEVVLDVNQTVGKVKEEVISELISSKTIKNPRVIKRIGQN